MKPAPASRRLRRLDDPAAARVLTEPAARRFLAPFIGRERSVRDVALELGVGMSSVLYRVRQFMRLELVEVARIEPRRGRPIRHYRATADGFFVPFGATSLTTQEAISPQAFIEWQRTLDRSIGAAWAEAAGEDRPLGIHVYTRAGGTVTMDVVPEPSDDPEDRFFQALLEPGAPAVWDSWPSMRLSRDDAKALQRDLASVFGRYRTQVESDGGQEYVVRLAMAPLRL